MKVFQYLLNYMSGINDPDKRMERGLLTKNERKFLRGELETRDDIDEDTYRYNLRSRFRKRMDSLEEDLALLRESGEGDLAAEFNDRFSRVSRLESRVEDLQDRLDESD